MAWSKVNRKTKKGLKWWFHKILCEFGWLIRNKDDYQFYYWQLSLLLKQGFNLYGDKQDDSLYVIEDGKYIFTKYNHQLRGFCCNNGCINCPFSDKSKKIV